MASMTIPERIRVWRDANGLSYRQAGIRFGCTGATVRGWEADNRPPKSDLMLAKVKRTLSAWEKNRGS